MILLAVAAASCTTSDGTATRTEEPASFVPVFEVVRDHGLSGCSDGDGDYTNRLSLQVDASGVVRRSAEGCPGVTWYQVPVTLVGVLADRYEVATGGREVGCESKMDGQDIEIVWLRDSARLKSCGPGDRLSAEAIRVANELLAATADRR